MTDLERQFWTDIRAALLQIAAAILRYKLGGGGKPQAVSLSPADSVAGIITAEMFNPEPLTHCVKCGAKKEGG